MNSYMIIIIVAAAVLLIVGGIGLLIPYFIKRGINVSGVIDGAEAVVSAANVAIDALREHYPSIAAFDAVDKVINWSRDAVAAAEQMYKTSQIPAEKRKTKAVELVISCVTASGINVDDNMKTIIDSAVEAAVYGLTKTHTGVQNE